MVLNQIKRKQKSRLFIFKNTVYSLFYQHLLCLGHRFLGNGRLFSDGERREEELRGGREVS